MMLALSGGLDTKMLKYVLQFIFRFTLQVKIQHSTKHEIWERTAAAQTSCHTPVYTNSNIINDAQTSSGDERPSHATLTDVKQALGKFRTASLIN